MNVTFTSLTRDNLAQFLSLYVSVFNAAPWHDGWNEQAARERLEGFAAIPRFHGLALCLDGTPVAMALGWGERWVQGWVFHLKEMCVSTTHQGAGIGNRLLSEFEKLLSSESFIGIYLQTGEAVPARTFYESAGYETFAVVSLRKKLTRQRDDADPS